MNEKMVDKIYEEQLTDQTVKGLEKELASFDPTQEKRSPKLSGDVTVDRIRDTIINLHGAPLPLVVPENTLEQMGLDSLESFDLQCELEEEFDVPSFDISINEKTTLAEIIKCVKETVDGDE